MFDCCTQRTKGSGLVRKISKRPMTPRRQQVEELARSWAQERLIKGASLDEQLKRATTPIDSIFGGCCGGGSTATTTTIAKTAIHSSSSISPVHIQRSSSMQSIASLPPSPSVLAKRKKAEPVPIFKEPIACDNFECITCEIQNENWTVARLGARVFRFCSQECWTTWLENPGHLGSWSSPLLSYQTSPEMNEFSPTASIEGRDSKSSEDATPRNSFNKFNLLDLPPLMI